MENGAKILLADAGMIVGAALIAMYLKNVELKNIIAMFFVIIYFIPYVVYQNKLN
jgi:hypothetical protein